MIRLNSAQRQEIQNVVPSGHDIHMSKIWVRNHLSPKDPTWRWWIGVTLIGLLTP